MAEEQKEHRKLAAIMFTDIVGYTPLSQKNESLALELLEEHRTLVQALITKYQGREIETIGDAFFVEFDSALPAVQCAIEIQQSLFQRNVSQPEERKIRLRIGLHLGEVVHVGGHVHGDKVNITSRVHPLASPGGIVVTEDFWQQLKSNPDYSFVALGARNLKGIKAPVRVFALNKVGLTVPGIRTRLFSRPAFKRAVIIPVLISLGILSYLFIPGIKQTTAAEVP